MRAGFQRLVRVPLISQAPAVRNQQCIGERSVAPSLEGPGLALRVGGRNIAERDRRARQLGALAATVDRFAGNDFTHVMKCPASVRRLPPVGQVEARGAFYHVSISVIVFWLLESSTAWHISRCSRPPLV